MTGRWDGERRSDSGNGNGGNAPTAWMPRHADPVPRETIERILSVTEASRLHERMNVTVKGILSGVQPLHKMLKGMSFTCMKCHTNFPIKYDKPELYESMEPAFTIKKCPNCKTGEYFMSTQDPINAVVVELKDTETMSHIDALQVIIFGDDEPAFDNTIDIENHLGEVVQVSGDIYPMKMGRTRNSPTVAFLYVKYLVKYLSKTELELSSLDRKGIKNFPRLVGMDNVVEALASMIATPVIGYNHVKKGLLLSAMSTSTDKKIRKLHVLLVGDPGLAKSELIKHSARLVPGSRYVNTQYATAKSLTVIVSKDQGNVYTLRLGPIPQAKGAIAALNEIGQMTLDEQGLLLDVMEEQHFGTIKYGRPYQIDSPTAIIASCNPKDGSWRGKDHGINDTDDVKANLDKIPLQKPLIDRIDFIFVFKDDRSKQANKKYADRKSTITKTPPPDYTPYLQKHILYAKRYHANPKVSDQARDMLIQYYVNVRATHGSPRIFETIVRIAQTIASLKLKG